MLEFVFTPKQIEKNQKTQPGATIARERGAEHIKNSYTMLLKINFQNSATFTTDFYKIKYGHQNNAYNEKFTFRANDLRGRANIFALDLFK
jgi:hypothetical protein